MSKKGGYQIVDLKNVPLDIDDNTPATIKGVYDAIEGNYGKTLIFSGVRVVSENGPFDITIPDCAPAIIAISSGTYSVTLGLSYLGQDVELTITADDEVSAEV